MPSLVGSEMCIRDRHPVKLAVRADEILWDRVGRPTGTPERSRGKFGRIFVGPHSIPGIPAGTIGITHGTPRDTVDSRGTSRVGAPRVPVSTHETPWEVQWEPENGVNNANH